MALGTVLCGSRTRPDGIVADSSPSIAHKVRVAAAAIDLLRFGPLDRLKVCEGCPWLFLDLSRNHSRRWCSMNICGGTRKMRRYRARVAYWV